MKKPRPKKRARVVIGRPGVTTRGEPLDRALAKIFRHVAGINHNPPQQRPR